MFNFTASVVAIDDNPILVVNVRKEPLVGFEFRAGDFIGERGEEKAVLLLIAGVSLIQQDIIKLHSKHTHLFVIIFIPPNIRNPLPSCSNH